MATDETAADGTAIDAYGRRVTRPLRRIVRRYGATRARWLAIGLCASVVSHGAALVAPFVLGTTVDAVFTDEAPYDLPLVPRDWLPSAAVDQFWLSAALIGGALALTAVMAWLRGFAMNYYAHGVMYDVRRDAYRQFQDLDMGFVDEVETGEVMSVLNNDTTNLERFLDNGIQDSVRIGVTVGGVTLLLVYLEWQLATITLAIVPLLVVFTWWFTRAVRPRYAQWRSEVGRLNTRLQNAIGAARLIKAADAEAHEADRIDRAAADLLDAAMSAISVSVIYRPGMRLLTGTILFVTFVVGGLWVFSGPPGPFTGDLTVGTFVVFVLLTQRLTDPLARLADVVDRYENATASASRICGLLDVPVGVQNARDATPLESVEGRVDVDAVTFAYAPAPDASAATSDRSRTDDGAPRMESLDPESDDDGPERGDDHPGAERVLEDVSFTAEPGETVALVGPTGAGKSTIAKLLLRLYDVDAGAVRVDGLDVRDCTLSSLRQSVGYVGQDTVLFDGTVAENLRYGAFDASDDAVREAARAARAHDFVTELPAGYDTRVGERGVKLSGGQRQRIALARVLLQDPAIVVLDEATASVDTETELLIQESLRRVIENRTTVAIAHRLSTIRDADRILAVEDGRIVERGTHEELLARDGLYATLWRIQAGEVDELPERLARAVGSEGAATGRQRDD